RRRLILYHLRDLRGAEQPGDAEGGSQALDRPDHDFVGHRIGLYGVRFRALFLLCGAVASGGGGGWLLPWRDPLSYLLVSGPAPRPHRCALHGGNPAVELLWFADLRGLAPARRARRPPRLAMDVHPGSASGRNSGSCFI